MKRLLLHLGYPKAASTTLQNGVFFELHQTGSIHFLGKATQRGYLGPANNKSDYKAWFRHVNKRDRGGTPLDLDFDEALLNVVSDEAFISLDRDCSGSCRPENIISYFSARTDDIRLLFVLRNQQTMVLSDYVQRYAKTSERPFSTYLHRRVTTESPDRIRIFNFDSLLHEYAKLVGQNAIHVLIFEDLQSDADKFCTDFSRAVGVSAATLKALLERAHYNKTPRSDKGAVVRKDRSPLLGWLRSRQTEPAVIPEISEDEKALIFNAFRAGNRRLVDEFGLDPERMRRYGYI